MNPLDKLNNVERAKLLFELFPGEMPGLMECMKTIAGLITDDHEKVKREWNGQILTADFWIELAKDAGERIEKNGQQLMKRSGWFSDQLFDGYNALFAVHCLQEHIKKGECDRPFIKAAEMLFNV